VINLTEIITWSDITTCAPEFLFLQHLCTTCRKLSMKKFILTARLTNLPLVLAGNNNQYCAWCDWQPQVTLMLAKWFLMPSEFARPLFCRIMPWHAITWHVPCTTIFITTNLLLNQTWLLHYWSIWIYTCCFLPLLRFPWPLGLFCTLHLKQQSVFHSCNKMAIPSYKPYYSAGDNWQLPPFQMMKNDNMDTYCHHTTTAVNW